jgi:hypothetical protein
MLIFPAGALLVTAIGLIGGWCHIRLLRDGELAWATVTGCKPPTNAESATDITVPECQRLLAEQAERAFLSPFVLLWKGVTLVWRLAVLLMVAGGTVFALFAMVEVGQGAEVLNVNGKPARGIEGVLKIGALLIVWLFVGGVMLFSGRRLRIPGRDGSTVLDCAYEFRLPGGEVIRSRDSLPAAALDDAEALLPVLYNPKWPSQALVLPTLSPPVEVSLYGGWESTAGVWPLLRLAAAVLALAGGPLLGLAFLDA